MSGGVERTRWPAARPNVRPDGGGGAEHSPGGRQANGRAFFDIDDFIFYRPLSKNDSRRTRCNNYKNATVVKIYMYIIIILCISTSTDYTHIYNYGDRDVLFFYSRGSTRSWCVDLTHGLKIPGLTHRWSGCFGIRFIFRRYKHAKNSR